MNRKELAAALAKKTETSNAAADKSIATLIEAISAALKKGDKVALVGFGTFEVRKRAARTGRNPKTGAALKSLDGLLGTMKWCRLPDSNWRPTAYKAVALPTELKRR